MKLTKTENDLLEKGIQILNEFEDFADRFDSKLSSLNDSADKCREKLNKLKSVEESKAISNWERRQAQFVKMEQVLIAIPQLIDEILAEKRMSRYYLQSLKTETNSRNIL